MAKVQSERDELIKSITKVEHKETQYKHEIKNREVQIQKLQDQIKAKLFDAKKTPSQNKENNSNLAN